MSEWQTVGHYHTCKRGTWLLVVGPSPIDGWSPFAWVVVNEASNEEIARLDFFETHLDTIDAAKADVERFYELFSEVQS